MKGVTDTTGRVVRRSEGTLGVISVGDLRLRPRPASYPGTLAAGFPSFGAAAPTRSLAIIAARVRPSMLELMDK